ncbi:DUF4011 domain-containing protein [Hungatella hathewayi]|uniref:DUF4011 domain-containing protein n=1 Tax=Hungatella hathewayi TaxID=154046 RepID=A0AAW9WNB1_9FIRM|nr:DUF4011 domain-containing protein [Hungatella hathewayi]MUB66472.1 DUF4011 domain-containing protein [Hungatella hathewayi]
MEWRTLFKQNVLNGAEDYIRSNSVQNLTIEENKVTATVTGIENYRVDISLSGNEVSSMKCSCPYAKAGSSCKHMAAVMLAWEKYMSAESDATPATPTTPTVPFAEDLALSEKERQPVVNTADNGLQLTINIDDVLTYAIVHNGAHIVRDICVKNISDSDLDHLLLQISSDNGLIKDFKLGIEKIKPDEELHFRNLDVQVNAEYLASLTERSICQLTAGIHFEGKLLASETANITALAFDQWPGLQYTPELLAAFAMPNHPVVTSMIQLAAKYLEKWTGDPSLAGYQFDDPNRVKQMAAAAYAAVQEKNITYAEPPSSFETFGQRIRLADAVLEQHLGTCMDMTLLYVACLEAMGLNPVMVMMKGHIFAGVWLAEESFADMIMEDPSQLEKRMSKGIHEIMVVECTAMCAGKSRSFDDAAAIAERNVANYSSFAFVIDVKRARSMGIRPLPVRIKTDSGFEVQHEDRKEEDITNASEKKVEIFDLPDSARKEQATKLTQWERKLLDLSLRNMLIHMRMTKAVVPLLSSDVSILEDALSDGEEFQVLPRPAEMAMAGEGGIPVEALGELGPFADFIALESKHKRLHSLYTEKELNSCLTKMYRSAKTSMEENGASTLYLALGLLRWFESKTNTTVRYAPIVLVPIDIVRKSASKGYAMHMRDEDAQINITLLEFLKQKFDLQIYGLNPPPMDTHGLDMPKIFAIIRHGVMNLPMWDVVEVGFIGNFSFSQFVMWNDIHNNNAFLENNKIVHSLMTGAVGWDCSIPECVDTDEAYLPVTVDSSQLRAINMAAADVSFVLHGPPGTGKSQTITAMAANALTKGKTILFVAEKMAALEVVQKRLAILGIQDFCLELHSNKATKKAVLDQLKRGLEIGIQGTKTDYDKKIQDIRKMRSELDAYAKALHRNRPFGKSLRQLMDIYETIPELNKSVRFDHAYARTLTERDLDHQAYSLERLVAAGKGIGHPHKHPLMAVHKTEYNQRLKFDLESIICAYTDALIKFQTDVSDFVSMMEVEAPVTEDEYRNICNYASSVIAAETIPAFLRETDNVDREFAVPEAYLTKQQVFSAKQADFLSKWNENFLRMDMSSYREKYDQANKKFFGKGKALASLTAELQAFAAFTIETDQIPVYLTDITFYQQEAQEMAAAEAELPYEWKQILKTCVTAEALQVYKKGVQKQLQIVSQYSDQIRKLEASGALKSCIQKARALTMDLDTVVKTEAGATELLDLEFDHSDENYLESRLRLCSSILENAASIKDWIVYQQFAAECRQIGLEPVCAAYEAGLPHDEVIIVYLRSIYRTIILSVIENEPVLNGFTGIGFNEKIAQFKKMDQEFMNLTKDEMFYKLTHQLPTSNDSVEVSKELNILRRAISSNGRGLSIRTLFEQIPHVLTRLCPCMLMSPISAAQYLKAENDLFDIVIFDEASQLPTCKAVGVLARGKNAVIVGDPNQMPPTSFFAGNTVDEDNLDIEDLDSILDDCLALGMPSAYLHWHYRSRHESLIAFSNQEFYENSMLTFPSVNDRERRVSLVKADGFFDRGKGRVNESEAKAIIAEIRRRYEDPERKNQSIGVVTFNISQQTLIEDMLQEEYQKDAAFDKWANVGEETLFVKNLENVQGDERDVILFSIAFGPDAEGRLSLNFGPLNKEGGWKRLNVAVSRARTEMIVFTTMTEDMIDLKRTKSKGVEALKDFLKFAQKGRLLGEYVETRVQKEQGIMEHICQAITDAGYQYQMAVGHSKFKVDIAVVNPYNPDEYLLGIMLDGESYLQSANTRDREVAQISVLNGLGWELHRIWTMDWWDNRDKELSRLLRLLAERKEAAYQIYQDRHKNDSEEIAAAAEEPAVRVEPTEEVKETNRNIDVSYTDESAEGKSSDEMTLVQKPVSADPGYFVTQNPVPVIADAKVASGKNEPSDVIVKADHEEMEYRVEEYISADVEVTDLSTVDYIKKENLPLIADKMQRIVDAEAPIMYDRLVKKTLRAFHIARSSPQTLEATDKALKKVSARINKQAGVKFYWRRDQEPDQYRIYRSEANSSDKRSSDEICQQELKNAVCAALAEKGAQDKESLMKNAIRTMGYARSSPALTAAAEKGLKYGRRTGEIVQNEEKRFLLGN